MSYVVQWDRMDNGTQKGAIEGYTWGSIRQSHVSYVVQWDRMDSGMCVATLG